MVALQCVLRGTQVGAVCQGRMRDETLHQQGAARPRVLPPSDPQGGGPAAGSGTLGSASRGWLWGFQKC